MNQEDINRKLERLEAQNEILMKIITGILNRAFPDSKPLKGGGS